MHVNHLLFKLNLFRFSCLKKYASRVILQALYPCQTGNYVNSQLYTVVWAAWNAGWEWRSFPILFPHYKCISDAASALMSWNFYIIWVWRYEFSLLSTSKALSLALQWYNNPLVPYHHPCSFWPSTSLEGFRFLSCWGCMCANLHASLDLSKGGTCLAVQWLWEQQGKRPLLSENKQKNQVHWKAVPVGYAKILMIKLCNSPVITEACCWETHMLKSGWCAWPNWQCERKVFLRLIR